MVKNFFILWWWTRGAFEELSYNLNKKFEELKSDLGNIGKQTC